MPDNIDIALLRLEEDVRVIKRDAARLHDARQSDLLQDNGDNDENDKEHVLDEPHVEDRRRAVPRPTAEDDLAAGDKQWRLDEEHTSSAGKDTVEEVEAPARRTVILRAHRADVAAKRDDGIAVADDHDDRDDCLSGVDDMLVSR